MQKHIKKQNGFSILAVILVIVAVVIAIGIWALSGNSNTQNTSNAGHEALTMSLINDGLIIKSVYDKYLITGIHPELIVYKPGLAWDVKNPNILDPVEGISIPNVSRKLIREGASFPEGAWLYVPIYTNSTSGVIDSQAAIVIGVTDKVCSNINRILFGDSRVPKSNDTLANLIAGVTNMNPTIAELNAEINISEFPKMERWPNGCLNLEDKPDNNVYFQTMKNK